MVGLNEATATAQKSLLELYFKLQLTTPTTKSKITQKMVKMYLSLNFFKSLYASLGEKSHFYIT